MPNPIKNCANPDCSRRVYCLDRNYCAKCWPKFTEEGRAYNAKRQREHVAKTKAHFAAVAAMKAAPLLLICASAGCASDARPPGFQMRHAPTVEPPSVSVEPPGLPPIDSPALRGGPAPGLLYDLPVGGLGDQALWRPGVGALPSWNPPGLTRQSLGGNAGGNLQTGGNGNGNNGCGNGNCNRPERPQPAVPGPIGLAGVAAAYGWARRMRRRVGR